MNVTALRNKLNRLIASGHGRAPVWVYKNTFHHNLPEVSHHDVCGVNCEALGMYDGDGWTVMNKDGSERQKIACVIYGSMGSVKDGHVEDESAPR